jgi:hypothetical protein
MQIRKGGASLKGKPEAKNFFFLDLFVFRFFISLMNYKNLE